MNFSSKQKISKKRKKIWYKIHIFGFSLYSSTDKLDMIKFNTWSIKFIDREKQNFLEAIELVVSNKNTNILKTTYTMTWTCVFRRRPHVSYFAMAYYNINILYGLCRPDRWDLRISENIIQVAIFNLERRGGRRPTVRRAAVC
jgi:hypothetical protein